MWVDPIVEEVRKIRQEHAAQFGYDLDKIVQSLQQEERQSGREVVTLPPRRPVPSTTTPEREGHRAAGKG